MPERSLLMPNVVDLTAELVSAYVSHNPLPRGDLPALVEGVHRALSDLAAPPPPAPESPVPPVPIKRTVTPDAIISLEDGQAYKSLKRHLRTRGLTPEAYRAKWGLPADYPMVAANYAAQRSELAKASGLGRRRN